MLGRCAVTTGLLLVALVTALGISGAAAAPVLRPPAVLRLDRAHRQRPLG